MAARSHRLHGAPQHGRRLWVLAHRVPVHAEGIEQARDQRRGDGGGPGRELGGSRRAHPDCDAQARHREAVREAQGAHPRAARGQGRHEGVCVDARDAGGVEAEAHGHDPGDIHRQRHRAGAGHRGQDQGSLKLVSLGPSQRGGGCEPLT